MLFYHNEEQKRLAIETRDREAARIKSKILPEILPAAEFYPAEAYHQKDYLRKQPDLLKAFNTRYPHGNDFMNSTATARVNGYLGEYGVRDFMRN
jgi:peptide-methionine (S)-S-oxide reductase